MLFSFRSSTAPQKKLLARAIKGYFVGLHSDETLFRVYLPNERRVIFTRVQDFRIAKREKLPSINTLLDGISRQSALEIDSNGLAEEILTQASQAYRIPLVAAFKTKRDQRLPRSFAEAVRSKSWRDAIDREYNALVKRQTWIYIRREPHMHPLLYTWVLY